MEAVIGFGIKDLLFMPAAAVIEVNQETALVDAARNGNSDAFGRLYEIHARMVHGLLIARTPRDEVDDLTQEVFLSAFRKLHTLRDSAAFGPWLAVIARNRSRDYYRHRSETEELEEETAVSAGSSSTEAEAEAILAIIRRLPDAYRQTLVLRLVEGMTGPEIAVRTGLTAACVRVNLHRGMKLLRDKLGGGRR